MNWSSIKVRFMATLLANVFRTGAGFLSSMLIARGLSPSGYGDMSFLIGSFAAVMSLMDMGTSSGFYTSISKKRQGRKFYLSYLLWQAFQFVFVVLLITLVLPDSVMGRLWLGQERRMILLAFVAVFLQQQLWSTVVQIGEAARKTVRVQVMNVVVALVNLAAVAALMAIDRLTITYILGLITVQYGLAALWAVSFLKGRNTAGEAELPFNMREALREYIRYSRPLAILSVTAFFYEFADRWILQHFGGSSQQGFYRIALQISTGTFIVINSFASIVWKEIAEAFEKNDRERVATLYRKAAKSTVAFSAVVVGMLLPWSYDIVAMLLGSEYAASAPVLAVMLFYPVFHAMSSNNTTIFLATGRTDVYTYFSLSYMLMSTIAAYFVQAPSTGAYLPGLGMGAMGMAIKTIVLTGIFVNLQMWAVARLNGWRFEWTFQFFIVGLMCATGFSLKFLTSFIWTTHGKSGFFYSFISAGLFYIMFVIGFVWMMPWIIGADREYLRSLVKMPWLTKSADKGAINE